MNPINLKGKRFGRLVVIEYDENSKKSGHAYWLCRCSCGKYKYVRSSHLGSGNTKSCGCLAADVGRKFLKKYANSKNHRGEGNPQWRGERAKYQSFHAWLTRHYKKTSCEECGSKKNLDWALKKGCKHGHDRKRYIVLCRTDHLKYDYTSARKKKIKGRKRICE